MVNNDKSVKMFYLFYAITGGVFTSLMPVYYVQLGYNESQIGVLTSLIYLAAILQPIFGYLSDSKYDIQYILRISLAIIMASCVVLYFFDSFIVVFFVILIASIFRMPIPTLFDSVAADYAIKHNVPFAKFRVYASFGFGASMLICIPFMYLFGFSAFLIVTIFTTLIAFITIANIPHYTEKKPHIKYSENIKTIIKNKNFIYLSLFTILFMGSTSIKFAYQSLLLQELTGGALYSSVGFLLSVTMEIVFMRYFIVVEQHLSFKKYMTIAVGLMLIQLSIFATSNNPNIILCATILHGVSMAVFIPGYMKKIKEIVPIEISTSSMIISSTIQNVYTFLFSLIIITPIFAFYGLDYVFVIMIIFASISIVPLILIKEKNARIWKSILHI